MLKFMNILKSNLCQEPGMPWGSRRSSEQEACPAPRLPMPQGQLPHVCVRTQYKRKKQRIVFISDAAFYFLGKKSAEAFMSQVVC